MKFRLAEIVDINMGQSPKSEFYNNSGNGLPFLQGNRTFGYKYPFYDTYTLQPTKIAKAGDVIMSVRAPVGDLNIITKDICIGRGLCSLRMKNNNQEFLFYLMKYYSRDLINKESGTVFGSINRNDISSLEVDIPENIETQQKIANILCAIDDKVHEPYRKIFIDGYQKLYNKLKAYGALGTFISGSGPTLASIIEADDAEFFYEDIKEYTNKAFPTWDIKLLDIDNEGAKVIK